MRNPTILLPYLPPGSPQERRAEALEFLGQVAPKVRDFNKRISTPGDWLKEAVTMTLRDLPLDPQEAEAALAEFAKEPAITG